ncbi:MAG TPA: MerR family transcriptional regulator [Xanthobacteraceae bacterium]|nr:MerR family transcriptional regulator [Xanthobacteraceae bacterium]
MEKAPDAFRTISEVAEELDLPQHVLRFWETRFSHIKPMKRGGGRRYYRPDDVDLLRGIRHLLYGEGYTIRGVQRILKDEGVRFVQAVWKTGAPQPAEDAADDDGEEGDIEPGRGLLGLWPSLLGGSDHSDDDEEEPTKAAGAGEALATPEDGAAVPSGDVDAAALRRADAEPARELAREHLRKLKATLGELSECRRLIEAALRDEVDVTTFGQS